LEQSVNYLIAVLADRTQAEAAYSALTNDGLTSDRVNILGKEFNDNDEFGIVDPIETVREAATQKLYVLVPLGFILAAGLTWATGIIFTDRLAAAGNYLVAGFFGALAGGIAAYLKSTNVGSIDADRTLPLRNSLEAGKYLVVVKDADVSSDRFTNILNQFQPETIENIQNNIDRN
jgi:hypothetical protein